MAITRYVNTASSPGGDGTTNATTGDNRAFASLNEAEAAIPASIADWYDIVCEGQDADTAAVDFAGTTTSASNYVQARTDPSATYGRHGGKWNADKYRLSLTSGTTYPLQIHEPYARIIGLQMYGWYQTTLHLAYNESDNSVIDSCIIWHGSSSNVPCIGDYGGATGNAKYVNSIFIQDAADRNVRLRGGGTKVLNCVAIGGTYGYRHEAGSAEIINSIGIGASEADFSGSFSGSTGNNASSDDSAPGSNSLTEIDPAAAFTDYTNGDFSLKSGSPLIDAGIGPALDSNVPTTDIVGNARSGNTCCIGAFEYVGSGGTTYTQSLTGELPYPSGSLLYSVAFSTPLTGDLPSPAGGVAKHISKPLAGDFPSVFGEAGKQTNKQLSGIPPSPSGSVVKHTDKHLLGDIPSGAGVIIPSSDIAQSVYGELPSPSGGAIKHTAKQLSGASPSPTGDSTKHISTTLRGEAPAPSGTPNQAYRTSQSTSGIMGLIFGAISSILNPIVSLRSAAGIIGSRLKRFIGG